MSRIGSNSIESVIDNTGLSRNRQNLGSCLKKRVSDSLLDFRIRLGMNFDCVSVLQVFDTECIKFGHVIQVV